MSKYGIGQPVLRFEDPRLLRGHGHGAGPVELAERVVEASRLHRRLGSPRRNVSDLAPRAT